LPVIVTPAGIPALMLLGTDKLKQLLQVTLDRLAVILPLTVEFTVTVVCTQQPALSAELIVAGLGVTVTVPEPLPPLPLKVMVKIVEWPFSSVTVTEPWEPDTGAVTFGLYKAMNPVAVETLESALVGVT
jgi:hypothetical protein